MDGISLALGWIVGVGIGGVMAWLARGRNADVRARQAADDARRQAGQAAAEHAARLDATINDLRERERDLIGRLHEQQARAERVPVLEEEVRSLTERLAAEAGQSARLRTELEKERQSIEDQKKLLAEARQQLTDAFKGLAHDALKQNSTSFLELARENLTAIQQAARGDLDQRRVAVEQLVKPLREQLERYEKQIREIEGTRQEAYGQLREQLLALNQRTDRLTLALRTPHTRGRWGEFQLKRVAELAGMIEHCDFDLQVSEKGEDGVLRPDMVVRLPGGAQFIVDAKTSLDAYIDACEKSDGPEKTACLQRHAEQVRRHMMQLSSKNYWAQFAGTPDFVVMFLPGEHFLSAALEQRPELIEEGYKNRVILATPSMLIALLRTAALAWRQEQITENAERISELAHELYERLTVVGEHLTKLGENLERSVVCYNRSIGSLEKRVLPAARRFTEMGIKPKKELPELEPIEKQPVLPAAEELRPASENPAPVLDPLQSQSLPSS